MANLRKVIYINEEDYSTLINGDSLVIDGTTYTYEENALYVIKNAGPPEYAETAGYATNAGTSLVAVTDASGNNIAATYGKKPLIIEVEDGDTEVPSGTFDSITGALNNGSRVIIKFISGDEYNTDIYYLPLTLHILCYTFEALIYKKYIWIEIDEYNNVSINNYNVSDDANVIHLNTTETITGNKTFSGTVSLGSNATATTPAATDNDTSVATTAFVHNVVNAEQVQADWNLTTTTAKDYIKNKPNITKTSNGNWDYLNINEEIINLNTNYAAYYNNKEIAVKDDIPSEIITGQIVGRMHRDNVSGTGNLTIAGASGEGFSPNGITTAGKYVVVVYSWSDTKTFGYNISFGSNSYTLSTTDGTISDKRELTVSAGALWSGSVTTAVSAGTTIIVEIYKAEKTTPALSVGTVALTNLYNDLDGKPTISDSTSSTSSTDIASSKAVKLAYDHGGVQSVNGQTGAVTLSIPDDSNLVHKTGDETISGIKSFQRIKRAHTVDVLNEAWNWITYDDMDGGQHTLQQDLDARNNVQADWNQTTATADDYIKNKPDIPVINAVTETYSSTAADTTTPFTASIWRVDLSDKVTELYSGLTILIKVPVAGNGTYGTLLRIDGIDSADDTSENLYPVCANVTTMVSTRYAVGCIIALTFDATQAGQTLYYNSASAYTTTASGTGWTKPGCWKIADYSTGDTTTGREGYYYMRPYAGQAVYRYKYLMEGADGRLYPIVTTNQTSGTSVTKTPTTVGLRPWKIWYYNHTDTVSAGAAFGALRVYPELHTTTATYNFNASTGTYAWIFLLGSYDKDTDLFTLDTGNNYYKFVRYNAAINWASSLTSGKYYILLGSSYSTTNYVLLYNVNPFYYFNGTNLIPVTTKIALDSGPVTSVNGLTGNVNLALGDTNVIESISVNGVAQTVTDKNVDITVSANITVDSELDSESTNPVENQAIFHALKKPVINNNGHEYVDLGLPSGTLWSTMYVGAASETVAGNYFRWGEVEPVVAGFTDDSYRYWSTETNSYTKYNSEDGLTVLQKEDDAASEHWGGDWYTPTSEDWNELISNCNISGNYSDGFTVTGLNGNSIFLAPCAWIMGSGSSGFVTMMSSSLTPNYYIISGDGSLHISGKFDVNHNAVNVRPVLKEGYTDKYVSKDDSPYEVTYAELKQLRDHSQLIPGKYYRIIDYVTTTNGINDNKTASACHQFDIIVRADGVNTLNEDAHAAVHAGDTYFADQNLAAWELKYKLELAENDAFPSELVLADSYTFKAMIARQASTYHLYLALPDYGNDNKWFEYTFNDKEITKVSGYGGIVDPTFTDTFEGCTTIITSDYSTTAVGNIVADVEGGYYTVVDVANITYESKGYIYYMKDEYDNECTYDFKNVLISGTSLLYSEISELIAAKDFFYTFNYDIFVDATIAGIACNNKINLGAPSAFPYVILNAKGKRVTIYNNIVKEDCFHCFLSSVTTRGAIEDNIINIGCSYITMSGASKGNIVEKYCSHITFGAGCTCNLIDPDCSYITFGNYCSYVLVDSDCLRITFGTSENVKNYYRNIIIEPGNQYIYLNNTQTTSNSNYCQNIKICSGVNNTTTWKQIDVDVVNNQYQIEYKSENSKTITV